MRCFIAIDIDEQIRKSLAKLQNDLLVNVYRYEAPHPALVSLKRR